MNKKNLTYKKSGVNIAAADNFIKFISSLNTKDKGKKSSQILEDSVLLQIFLETSKNQK